jgi:hypothetical protein
MIHSVRRIVTQQERDHAQYDICLVQFHLALATLLRAAPKGDIVITLSITPVDPKDPQR